MRAVYYEHFGQLAELRDVPDPDCPAAGVIIQVEATGLCRSDWHAWMGHDPEVRLPHVPGHEFAGLISEIGPRVQGWRTGDRVTVPFGCACGQCATCRRGEQQVCERQFQPGFSHWGSFAELVAIDHANVNLVRVPEEMALETAASLGCRFSTAYRAVVHHARVRAGDWVVVHGCGGVGLSAVMIAAARGAQVIAVDVSAAALELALAVGAVRAINATQDDVVSSVRELTSGGAEVSIDALGSMLTCQNSMRSLRARGRHIQIGLMLAADSLPPIPMATVIAQELQILGSHGMAAREYPAMLSEILAGTLKPQHLIRRRIALAGVPAALGSLDQQPADGITIIEPARGRLR